MGDRGVRRRGRQHGRRKGPSILEAARRPRREESGARESVGGGRGRGVEETRDKRLEVGEKEKEGREREKARQGEEDSRAREKELQRQSQMTKKSQSQ